MAEHLDEVLTLASKRRSPSLIFLTACSGVCLRRFMIVSILPSHHGKHDHALGLAHFKRDPVNAQATGASAAANGQPVVVYCAKKTEAKCATPVGTIRRLPGLVCRVISVTNPYTVAYCLDLVAR